MSDNQKLSRTEMDDIDDDVSSELNDGLVRSEILLAPLHQKSWHNCKKTLCVLLGQYNSYSYDQKRVIGERTKSSRRKSLLCSMRTLNRLGSQLQNVSNLKPKHIEMLMTYWEASKLSPSYLQQQLSDLRTLSRWVGKDGMVLPAKDYVKDPQSVVVKTVPDAPKGWFEQPPGFEPVAVFTEVCKIDRRVAIQLMLMAAFGLRAMEAATFKPHLADQGSYIAVSWGTKGKRDRTIPFKFDYQLIAMELAKQVVEDATKSLIPSMKSYSAWYQHFYRTTRKCGISRTEGMVPHGLRHSYAAAIYSAITGEELPLLGGAADPNNPMFRMARLAVSEHLGHSRIRITSGYIGAMLEILRNPEPDRPVASPSTED